MSKISKQFFFQVEKFSLFFSCCVQKPTADFASPFFRTFPPKWSHDEVHTRPNLRHPFRLRELYLLCNYQECLLSLSPCSILTYCHCFTGILEKKVYSFIEPDISGLSALTFSFQHILNKQPTLQSERHDNLIGFFPQRGEVNSICTQTAKQ